MKKKKKRKKKDILKVVLKKQLNYIATDNYNWSHNPPFFCVCYSVSYASTSRQLLGCNTVISQFLLWLQNFKEITLSFQGVVQSWQVFSVTDCIYRSTVVRASMRAEPLLQLL